jgi:hypothetical protein
MPDISPGSAPPVTLDPNAPPTPDSNGSPPLNLNNPPPTDWAKSWVKDGAFDHTALDKAPDDFKALRKELETFKDVTGMAKSMHELRALSSKKGTALLEPLPKDATPEVRAERMAAIRQAVGAPDKPEGYVIEKPKDLPDTHWDVKALGEATKIAFEEGVSPTAMNRLVSYETQRGIAAAKAQEEAVKTMWADQDKLARETMVKEGMDYAGARDLAERAAKRYAGIDKDNPLFQNATFLMMAARVGKAMGESKIVQGDTSDDALKGNDPATAQKALDNIRENKANPEWFAYWNRNPEHPNLEKVHPDHDKVVAKAKALSAIANRDRDMRGARR